MFIIQFFFLPILTKIRERILKNALKMHPFANTAILDNQLNSHFSCIAKVFELI